MGEARRRKQILGSEYGKPGQKNFQVTIFDRDLTNQKIKKTELSRLPIPELEYLKSRLNSIELKDWLVNQWNIDRSNSFLILLTPEDTCKIASILLEELCSSFWRDLNSDSTIRYNPSSLTQISVGINVYSWTVWTFIEDRSTGFSYTTADADEFRLV